MSLERRDQTPHLILGEGVFQDFKADFVECQRDSLCIVINHGA